MTRDPQDGVPTIACPRCRGATAAREATADRPYRYRWSGLDSIVLLGITVYDCESCGDESALIPRVEELHQVIFEILLLKPTALDGREIRFLRKRLGMPANVFAAQLGVSAEHFSRVENGAKPVSAAMDRLARVVAATEGGRLELIGKRRSRSIRFRGDLWEPSEAA